MPVYNQSRSRIIKILFAVAFLVIIAQLFYLQIISDFRSQADEQAILRKTIYPSRGIVFDRKRKAILDNTLAYDLMVTPSQLKGVDTLLLCRILEIDTVVFRKRIITAIIKNTSQKPSVFEASISKLKFARMQENMFRFSKAFFLQERPVRRYPYEAGANIFGYMGEVDTAFLRKHDGEGYQQGDYTGFTGIERTYEKALMGERGLEIFNRDKLGRIVGSFNEGKEDVQAVAGSNLYTELDIELQLLGEKLMSNKVGSIVAVNPKTGGIIAMVSSPTYNPTYLTGSERSKHFSELYVDPKKPLLNRAVNAAYSPGSTFKTLQALVGLHEGVLDPSFTVSCGGAFYGCGGAKPMGCLDIGTFDLLNAIRISDNTYFATVMQRVINNPKYPTLDSSLRAWDNYMYAFGLGRKLGVDIPTERRGNIPTPEDYDKIHGKGKWTYCSFRSVSIGQGEVDVTPIQVANEMAYIANKGFYYIPHVVDSIEGGDKFGLLEKFKKPIRPIDISEDIFDIVHEGMQRVVDGGTGGGARVPGIAICGKTGTVENYAIVSGKLAKQPNHSFFCGFAPRENPRIAIMCVVENSGRFGGTFAAPIVGLMIEKYLNDTLAKARKAEEERLTRLDLIPPLMRKKIHELDSLRKVKEEMKRLKDTLQIDITPEEEELRNVTQPVRPGNNTPQKNDTQTQKMIVDTNRQRNLNPDNRPNTNK
jgi:penicillin-binding protein 2